MTTILDFELKRLRQLWHDPQNLKYVEASEFSEEASKIYAAMRSDFEENGTLDLPRIFSKLNRHATTLAEIAAPVIEESDQAEFFPTMTPDHLIDALGSTIKYDNSNKVITFLCQLTAYTEDSQINITFNAPSSTGKSYIPIEISEYFPSEDVIKVGYCSPTAFFHSHGKYDDEIQGYRVDLSRKILIFLDQPHTLLLQHLRPLLSHDQKEISIKITDKSQKHGLRTKNIILKGYPAVIFCTANLRFDEQEATRFILLSPQTDQEKLRASVYEKIHRKIDPERYKERLEQDPNRQALIRRVEAIKKSGVDFVKIESDDELCALFLGKKSTLKPRDSRDVGRFIDLMTAFALLNLWHRKREGNVIYASGDDFEAAFRIWQDIAQSQELNLSPYVFQIYKEAIFSRCMEFGRGITRQEVLKKHLEIYGRPLPEWQLRQQIIPMLENSGLVIVEEDSSDKRRKLIIPAELYDNKAEQKQ